MKKLMFATALAVSAAAFAEGPLNAISFEGYSADATVGNAADIPDASGGDNGMYFYFDGDQDGSTVKAYGGENLAAPTITRPLYFASTDSNENYLELSTEGGVLWRSINTISSVTVGETTTYGLGTAQAVAADGTYLDTLVQFTPTEDGGAPEVDGADKLAIWLNVDSSGAAPVTNLMVKAKYWYLSGDEPAYTVTNFTVSGVSVAAGEWYRLTIKAVPALTTYSGCYIPAFQIFIDGTSVAATESQLSSDLQSGFTGMWATGMQELVAANKMFPSLAPTPASLAAVTLQGIGFKGSGALDDIVWTTEDPFAAVALDFTLTWPAGVTPTSYTINGGEPVALALGSTSPFQVPGVMSGDMVAFTFTNADGATKTMSLEAAVGATDIDASTAVYEWADYLGDAVNGAYTIDDANDLDMLRKGVDAGIATTGETFKQTANIDMTSAGAFAGIGAVGAENATTLTMTAFEGTYDGGNFTISNITFTNRKGSGLFNLVRGATIKDLVIDTVSYEAPFAAAKLGGAMFVGNGVNCTLQHLVTLGSNGLNNPSTYNAAGIANRLEGRGGPVRVIGCTNNAAIYCVYSKVAGICPIVQGADQPVTFVDCANTGNIVANGTAEQVTLSGKTPGVDGAAGIVAYSQGANNVMELSFTNCVNTGTITPYNSSTRVASIFGYTTASGLTFVGGSAQANLKAINTGADKVTGLKFATVDNGVATFVADDALAAGNTYLLTAQIPASAAPVFTLTAVGQAITFDEAVGCTNVAGMVGYSGAAGAPAVTTSGTEVTYTSGYFPRTATAGQDGSAANPFEIADEDDLLALQAAVDANVGRNLSYVQVADIALTAAWPGIGVGGGKDLVNGNGKDIPAYEAGAFSGVYDGGNYTISNFQLANGADYGALFNSINGATIKNLKISWGAEYLTPSHSGDTGATFVGVARNSTLLNLTTLAGTVTTVSAGKDIAGIVGYLMAGSTVDSCTNEINVASLGSSRKCGGIAIISQDGSGTAVIRNCKNSGTVTAANKGGILGYVGVATEIDGCENTAALQLFHFQSGSVTASGVNKGNATVASNDKSDGVSGLCFATVDGDVATFVADNALALNGEYKVMSAGATATFAFAEAGTIAFDTALFTPTYAITAAEGLTLTDATSGTVKTYTAAGAGGGYKVVIAGSDVAITPTAEDFDAMVAAVPGLDTNDVNAVNAALATEIGSTGIPAWQAAFLGLPPTEAGLESFKIDSISFNEDGNVVVTLPATVDPKTGRGVNITLKLKSADTPNAASWTDVESATGTTFAPFAPGSTDTKKFYKVVVEFAGSSN